MRFLSKAKMFPRCLVKISRYEVQPIRIVDEIIKQFIEGSYQSGIVGNQPVIEIIHGF